MSPENWVMLAAAVFGIIASWDKASGTIRRWLGTLNLYHRVGQAEAEIDELESMAHAHESDAAGG